MSAEYAYSFSHCGICVSDLERSVVFYQDGLGFELGDRIDVQQEIAEIEGSAALTLQFLLQGLLRLELLAFRTPHAIGSPSTKRNQLGLTHLSFVVEDIDAAAHHLVACGGSLIADTRSRSEGPGPATVFVSDPDGTRIELMSWPAQ